MGGGTTTDEDSSVVGAGLGDPSRLDDVVAGVELPAALESSSFPPFTAPMIKTRSVYKGPEPDTLVDRLLGVGRLFSGFRMGWDMVAWSPP